MTIGVRKPRVIIVLVRVTLNIEALPRELATRDLSS